MCAEHLQQAMDLFDEFYLKRRWVLWLPPPWSSDQGTQPLMEKKRLWNCKKLYSVSIEWTGFFPGWGWRLINLQVKIKMKAIASGLLSHTETSFSFCHPPGFSLALTLLLSLQKSFFKSPGPLRSHVEKLRYSSHIAQQECFFFCFLCKSWNSRNAHIITPPVFISFIFHNIHKF